MSRVERFSQIRRRLQAAGWTLARIRGSHHVFTKSGELPISIPVHRGKTKAVYARKVEEILRAEIRREENGQ